MSRLPPAEKLPLALRKNVRDEWESKKADHEKELSEVMGESWTIDIDPLAVYPYAKDKSYGKESTGSCINAYVVGAVKNLRRFVEAHGDLGKDEINKVASDHVLTLDLDEKKRVSYSGVEVSGGKLVILFAEGGLGSNIDNALEKENLVKALNEVPAEGVSYLARAGIKENWDPKVAEIQASLKEILKTDVTVDPRFEENFAKAKAAGKAAKSDWELHLGSWTKFYFLGLVRSLERNNFGSDEMMREAFNEAVEKNTVVFRLVDAIKSGYGECVIEDGVFYMQATPKDYGSNIDSIAEKVVDLL